MTNDVAPSVGRIGPRKRILIVSVNWIGDVIFMTPFIRAVREAYPESYIACLIHPRCREIIESNPRLNEIITYDEEGVHKSLWGKIVLVDLLRGKKFDTAFILHRSFTKALLVYLAGAGERIGYSTKHRSSLLTAAVEEPAEAVHKVEYFLNLAKAAGIASRDDSYEFFIRDPDRQFIGKLLKDEGVEDADTLITICPGGNWDPKRWPKENFAKAADLMAAQFGARIAIAGAAKDAALAGEIKGMMKAVPVITCGRTTLGQLGALLERSGLVVANDTGPMHIAVSVKTKVIALFGPTSPHLTGPYGRGSYRVISRNDTCDIPCYDFTCKDNRCMAAITVEEVFAAAKEMMSRNLKSDAGSTRL